MSMIDETDVPGWLDTAEYPFALQRFRCDEGELSYLDVGAGDPLLFVHGTPSWSFEWRKVIAALAPERRCVAIDHLGFGLSDKPQRARLRPEDHARRLAAFVHALDLRNLTLVVHDFGGPIAASMALTMPERIARIVVLNSWLWPNGREPGLRRLDFVLRSWVGKLLYLWLNVSPRFLLPAAMANPKALTPAVHRHYLAPFARRGSREGLYQLACALVGSDAFYAQLWARRTELASRLTDLVWGTKDPVLTERHLARWQEAFPHATVHRVGTAGHFVAEEAPDTLVQALRVTLGRGEDQSSGLSVTARPSSAP
jgi:pimeloyl-ACP methyl ester carboxylesterase